MSREKNEELRVAATGALDVGKRPDRTQLPSRAEPTPRKERDRRQDDSPPPRRRDRHDDDLSPPPRRRNDDDLGFV